MTEIIIVGILILVALATLLMFLHRRVGPAVWPFGLIILPLCLALMVAEIEIARGVLAVYLGSVSGAVLLAFGIAAVLLISAHFVGDGIFDNLENGTDYSEELYNGRAWRPSRVFIWGVVFAVAGIFYGCLGALRTSLAMLAIGADNAPMGSKYMFFLYPVFSFGLGLAGAMAIRSMSAHFKRWKHAQYLIKKACVYLPGRTTVDKVKRISGMIEEGIVNGEEDVENINEVFQHLEAQGAIRPALPAKIPDQSKVPDRQWIPADEIHDIVPSNNGRDKVKIGRN